MCLGVCYAYSVQTELHKISKQNRTALKSLEKASDPAVVCSGGHPIRLSDDEVSGTRMQLTQNHKTGRKACLTQRKNAFSLLLPEPLHRSGLAYRTEHCCACLQP